MSFLNPFSSIVEHQWSYEKIARYIFLATIFLAIIVLIPVSSIPFLYTKISLFALGSIIAFVVYVLARLFRGSIVFPPLLLLGAIWLVPLAYALSALFSGAPTSLSVFGQALNSDTFGFMLLVGFLGTIAALLVRRIEHYHLFFRIGTVLAGVVFLIQFVIFVAGYFAPTAINSTMSIVGSFSDLTIFAGLSIVMTLLAFRFTNINPRWKNLLYVMLVLTLIFVALANSIITWVLVALVALGLFIESIMHHSSTVENTSFEKVISDNSFSMQVEEEIEIIPNTGHTHLITPLVVLITALIFLIGGATISGALGGALHVEIINVRPSWQSTLAVGSKTYATSAIFGSGPNTFAQQWLTFRSPSLNATPFWNTNFISGIGFIPTSFVTTGIVGIFAWLTFLALFIFFGLRALLMREVDNPVVRPAAIAVFIGALYLMTELIFAVPGPTVIALTFILAGVFISMLRHFEPRGEHNITFAESPRVGFAIVFVLMLAMLASIAAAYVVVERYVAQVEILNAQNEISVGNLTGANIAAQRSLFFAESDRAYQVQTVVGLARIRKIEQDKTLSAKEARAQLGKTLAQTIIAAKSATRFDPRAYQNWYMLGNVYQSVVPVGVSGSYNAAVAAYKEAQKLNPTSPIIPFTLAQLAIINKDYKAAEPLLKEAIALKGNYTPAIFLFSQTEVKLGKAKEALQAAEAAAYFAPNNPTVLFQVGVLKEGTKDFAGAIDAFSQAVKNSPQYANARYFLAVAYAHQKDYAKSLTQIKVIAALSKGNAKALSGVIVALEKNTNPFTQNTSKNLSGKNKFPALSGK